ncbi:hypothetical protein GLOTRDRAFT_133642 [Gloeophyllum trabeum ATCC 11539]|uniref:F-box domain-containing protein n=1 Tax=Gloeophyllum trabeum (strain ATCC 11539 / FP-39264 / Madison 617) TaxID=670483 RepID=S7REJ4_GLOTA|nr:uncharacterized protein GLOTRDRAFT_133642 [Gloeophyllum trabeum ATCC 11539]EPQ50904.1 hypothetical protein GLOTRDRAFT_133642 [Gloeophyllum trabeum ATCC 11539]
MWASGACIGPSLQEKIPAVPHTSELAFYDSVCSSAALPNLANFTVRTRDRAPGKLRGKHDDAAPRCMLSALACCSTSLRVVGWDTDVGSSPSPEDFRSILNQSPCLQVINAGELPPVPPLVLPNLSFLSHDFSSLYSPFLPGIDRFEALRELVLSVPPKSWQCSPLSSRTSLSASPPPPDACSVLSSGPRRRNAQPQVTHHLVHLFPSGLSLPNIERLGLGCHGWHWRKDIREPIYHAFLGNLSSMHAPKLAVVCFDQEEWHAEWSTLRVPQPDMWAMFRELARRRGFRFEDSFGEVMH